MTYSFTIVLCAVVRNILMTQPARSGVTDGGRGMNNKREQTNRRI
jgi:hypothetical protein